MLEDKEIYYSLVFNCLRFDKNGYELFQKNRIAKKVITVIGLQKEVGNTEDKEDLFSFASVETKFFIH